MWRSVQTFAAESVVAMAVRSVLCVPLLDDDQIVGAVYVDQTQGSVAELQQATKFMSPRLARGGRRIQRASARDGERRAEWCRRQRTTSEDRSEPSSPCWVACRTSRPSGRVARPRGTRHGRGGIGAARRFHRRRPVDVSAVVERSCASLERDVAGHGARLVWSTAPDLFVMGVSLDLQRCLSNLVRNAARFSQRAASFAFNSRHGDAVVLTVQDEAAGIPPAILPTLFQRGVTGGGAQSQTGLGLAIVADRVRGLGGQTRPAMHPAAEGCSPYSCPAVNRHRRDPSARYRAARRIPHGY